VGDYLGTVIVGIVTSVQRAARDPKNVLNANV
jgi:hypothetical protein